MEQFDGRKRIEYGASELKRYSHKYYAVAFILALAFHFLGIGAYWGSVYCSNAGGTVTAVVSFPYPYVVSPDPIPQPGVWAGSRGLKPKLGTPVPVRPNEVDSTEAFPTQVEAGTEPGGADPEPDVGKGPPPRSSMSRRSMPL